MSVNEQSIKVKADVFIDKLSEYISKNNKKSKIIPINNLSYKSDRVLLTPLQLKEFKELISDIKVKKQEEKNNKVNSESSNRLLGKLQYNPDTNSFSLSDSMIEILSPNKQSFEVRGMSDISNEQFQRITDRGSKSKTYTKIKADSFIKRISNINENEVTYKKNNVLHINSVFLDFIIGKTTKNDFINKMNNYSNIKYNSEHNQNFLIYYDIGLTAYFDSNEKIEELEFSESFKGITKKGLKMNDSVSKAVKLYGNPVDSDESSINWKGLKVTYNDSNITSISINDNVESILFEKNLLTSDFSIYSEGMLLGLILDNTTKSIILNGNDKKYVIDFMKEYSNIKISDNESQAISYSDIGINFYFDKNNSLTAMEIGESFLGKTIKGLKIGDKLEKAIKLYGNKPGNNNHLSYKRMKIYHDNNFVTGILVFRENK